MLWTAAYVGLGYNLGGSPEFAASFLANLTGLVLSLVMLAGALLIASERGHRAATQSTPPNGAVLH